MQGLIDDAEKYNLSAVGAVIKAEDLKTGYIVHMNIDNTEYWAVIENITEYGNLNDVADNVILPIDESEKCHVNKTVQTLIFIWIIFIFFPYDVVPISF